MSGDYWKGPIHTCNALSRQRSEQLTSSEYVMMYKMCLVTYNRHQPSLRTQLSGPMNWTISI